MEEKFDVVIAGAGASGLMCAWQCGRQGKKVLVMEKNETAGKKILASGNGRCNFSNLQMRTSCYHGEKEKILETITTIFRKDNEICFYSPYHLFSGW